MIRNLKSYEDARDTAQFNGMSRKAGNQYRETYPQYGTHQQSGHPVRDGMNYQQLTQLPLGITSQAAAAAAASAANAPPHTTHFVQGNPLQNSAVATGRGGNLHGITSHGGITTSSQTVLPLTNQHSQGPTPASTPPAAPNDPKVVSQYPPQQYSVMYNQAYQSNRLYYQHNPPSLNQNNRMRIPGQRTPFVVNMIPQTPVQGVPPYLISQTSIGPNSNPVASLNPYPNQDHYGSYFISPQPNPISNYAPFPPPKSNQSIMPTGFAGSGIIHFNSNSSMPQTSQSTVNRSSKKVRSYALKIIDPSTNEEVDVENSYEKSTSSNSAEKNEQNEAKNNMVLQQFATEVNRRASELTTTTTAPPLYAKKEPSVSAINGSEKNNTSFIPPEDWKPSSHANASSDSQNVSDNNEPVGGLKPTNAAFNTVQPAKVDKMDYKRPTREEPSATNDNTEVVVETKPRDRIPSTSWPESATSVAVTQTVTAPKSVTTTVTKKAKEPEPSVPSSVASPITTIPSHPSSDGLKASSVTSTALVLEDNETSKKTPKQGIQSVGTSEDEATTPKQQAKNVANTASSHPLPQVSQAPVTASTTPPAQTNVAKTEKVQPQTSPLTSAQKPSTSALQTSGPASQKAPNVQPFLTKNNASATQGSGEKTSVKDEKPNPSKTKNRGKENAENNDAKNKGNQTFNAKHHNNETKNAAPSPAVVSKQTNGETETQNASEGKSKKNKKPNKKEINKKGSEKEGSDMDVFAEKPSANRPGKTNSSQRNDDVKDDSSAGEPVVKNLPSIPPQQAVPATDLHKTEQIVTESRPRKYTIMFLRQLREYPECNKIPKIALSHLLLRPGGGSAGMSRSQNGHGPAFYPHYGNPARNSSMTLPMRKSQQGRMKNDRQGAIHLSLSNVDVPLRQSKDAWKPTRLNPELRQLTSEEKKTQELNKAVTGILNKLTPEKFDTLVEKIKSLPIDSAARLSGVIDLIFEKAVDEPGFCRCYAEMCAILQHISVNEENGKAHSFRNMIITKCQERFQKNKVEESDVVKKQEEIRNCKDPDKKKELQLHYEEFERRVRRKSVGNCRFIGELFKIGMLIAKIMVRCISQLVNRTEEESLECLCKLLTTIGKMLEQKIANDNNVKKELNSYFDKMRELSERKQGISSRIRFMLQDVLDLRKNNWVPRREADNPKKIEQINTEIEKKEQELKLMNLQPPRRNEEYYKGGRDFKKNTRTGSQNDDDWKNSKNYKTSSYKLDASKFSSVADHDLSSNILGSSNAFKKWGSGVATGNKMVDKKTPSSYPFMDKSMLSAGNRGSANKITPTSSMEKQRPYPMSRDGDLGKISRSGSSQNIHPASRENSVQRQPPSRNASQSARQPPAPPMLNDDELNRACSNLLQEYFLNNSLKDTLEEIEERFNSKQLPDVIRSLLSYVIESKPMAGGKCGVIVANLIKRKTIPKQHYFDTVHSLIELAEDIILDCPKMWETIADTMSAIILEDCLSISELKSAFPGSPFIDFIKIESSRSSANEKDYILSQLLKDYSCSITPDYEVRKFIDENFENSRRNKELVYKLTTSICQTVFEKWQVSNESSDAFDALLLKFKNFFKWYIENEGDLEFQCLKAVNDFVKSKEYPSGLLLKFFEYFFDQRLISYDSYMQCKNSNMMDGVSQMTLKSFYDYIGNPPSDDNSTAD